MKDKNVQMTVEGGLGIITMDHPPRNLLSREMINGLDDILDTIQHDRKVKATVLTGSGDCFSYGVDLREIAEVEDAASMRELCIQGQTVFNRFWTSRVPTIAALNGKCLGGGLEIALACHLRVADDEIRMGFPEIRLGFVPGLGGTQRMARLAGPSAALDYVMTGRMMSSREALALGLVNEVSPPGEALEYAKTLGRRIAEKSPHAIGEALASVTRGFEMDLTEAIRFDAGCFSRLFESSEVEEGLRAFFEGRRAKFTDVPPAEE